MMNSAIECASRIERVVVYARGAVVTRRVALPDELPEGPLDLRVGGLTALAKTGSVRALVDGDREVAALKTRISIPEVRVDAGPLRERLRAIDLERQRIEAERTHKAARRNELAALSLDPSMARPLRQIDPAARIADALALGGLVGEEIAWLDRAIRDLDEALEESRRAREAAELAASQASPDADQGDQRAWLEVLVRLGAGGAIRALDLEYVITAARWWPAYTARFTAAATKVELSLDALVAQASGEDWSRVRLAVTTADLAYDARLPELRSLRLGRAQPALRRGYRSPPEGLDAMFEGFDRAASKLSIEVTTTVHTRVAVSADMPAGATADVPQQGAIPADLLALLDEAPRGGGYPEEEKAAAPQPQDRTRTGTVSRSLARREPAAPSAPAYAMPTSAAMPYQAQARLKGGLLGGIFGGGGSAGAAPEQAARDMGYAAARSMDDMRSTKEETAPEAIEPGDAWLDFDALRLADPTEKTHRGRLVRARADVSIADRANGAWDAVERLAGPPSAIDPLEGRGRFDHRYDAEGTSDVPSNTRPHRIAIARADATATPRFVAVPREAAEVYREVELKNPFAAPLLTGPVDVFLDGALMTTSSLSFVDKNGLVRLGLGVEDRLRVARNARVEEGTAGLLGGSTTVDHAITIDLSSSLGHKVAVDVLDRVPVTDDKDIEVKLAYARPEGEKYTQTERGAPVRRGLKWRVEVPPCDKARIEFGYRVTLPAKNEIVGGNRRD